MEIEIEIKKKSKGAAQMAVSLLLHEKNVLMRCALRKSFFRSGAFRLI